MIIKKKIFESAPMDVKTMICPFSFEGERPIPNQFHPFTKKKEGSENLLNCFVAWVGESPILRTGLIDSQQRAIQFLAMLDHINEVRKSDHPHRVCSRQIGSLFTEWETVDSQHHQLIEVSVGTPWKGSIVHLFSHLDRVYLLHKPRDLSESELHMLQDLPKLLNMDSWVIYCRWYNSLLEKLYSNFEYDSVDEYSLERHLKDFSHEVKSDYLAMAKSKLFNLIMEIVTRENNHDLSYEKLVDLEKDLLLTRNELKRMIEAHYKSLVKMNKDLLTIQEAHPELSSMRVAGALLEELLAEELGESHSGSTRFVPQQMLVQLLNDQLGVISAVSSVEGVERLNSVFAIRLAVSQLRKLRPVSEIIDLVMNWSEVTKLLHQFLSKEEVDGLTQWIQGHQDRKRLELLVLFWDLVDDNQQNICHPISELNQEWVRTDFGKEGYLNQSYLEIIPPYEKKDGSRQKTLIYDPETSTPIGLRFP